MIIENPGYRQLDAGSRKGIIGGSQIGAVLGLPGYVTKYSVYRAYMGFQDPVSPETEWTLLVGRVLEGPIAQLFSAKTGFSVKEVPEALYDPAHPYLILHPDREFRDLVDGKRYALECKTASMFAVKKHWPEPDEMDFPLLPDSVTVYDGKSLPPQYRAQCLWYTAFGYDGVFLARLADNQLSIYFVEPNERYEKALLNSAIRFHDDIEGGWVPEPERSADAQRSYPKSIHGERITADFDAEEAYRKLKEAEDRAALAEAEAEAEKARIMDYMKDAELLKGRSGETMATWKTERRKEFDSALFRKEHPDLWARYSGYAESRVFRVK